MNEELAGLLGVNLPKAKEEAFTKGLLGAIFQAAALSGPQRSPVGTAQGLGQVGLTALGGYESSMDKTLEQAIKGLQVRELVKKQKEAEQLRALAPQMFQVQREPLPTTGAFDAGQGLDVMQGGAGAVQQPRITGVSVNRELLPALAALGPSGMEYASNIAKFEESLKPKTYTLKPGEQVVTEGGQVKASVPATPEKVDLGTHIAFVDPQNPSRVISTIPKGKDLDKLTTTETTIGKMFTAEAAPYIGISQAYTKIESAAKNKSPAGDLSLIFGYMKILDPGSVVREGEFATAQNTGSVPESISALYNRVLNGERLTDRQRADFLSQAQNLVRSQQDLFNKTIAPKYVSIIETNGLNPKNVVYDPFSSIDLTKPTVVAPQGQDRTNQLRQLLFPNQKGQK